MFNEGYFTHTQDELVREELCFEAIRLAEFLCDNLKTSHPKTFALTALLCFQVSRIRARLSENGDLLLLEEQDRKLWDHNWIEKGFVFLNKSAEGSDLTAYHLQAGIAACHASSPSIQETNWDQIIGYYDQLLELFPGPVLQLNRAIAIGFRDGFESGIREIERSKIKSDLKDYYLLFGALAEMHMRLGQFDQAKIYFSKAISLDPPGVQKKHLLKRLEKISTLKRGS
jgi:RNA polymerase sigma-70 factor (ECF subfamily)